MTRVEKIQAALAVAFAGAEITVQDDSHLHAGHAGAATGRGHFSVFVVSKRFAGMNTLRRHRLVYEVVGDMMATDIHALSIQALAPGEPIPS